MNKVTPLTRAWVWCKRFRNRCGYGVHSPFAFNLITWVIYEKYPFYAYDRLKKIRKELKGIAYKNSLNTEKVDKLLFRLVNEMQPKFILEVGTQSGLSTLYMASANTKADVITFDIQQNEGPFSGKFFAPYHKIISLSGDVEGLVTSYINTATQIDFVHFNRRKPEPKIYEQLFSKTHTDSLFVIEGIHDSKCMQEWWSELVKDEHTGITFDLYDLGLIFYDKTKIKQHYIVNF